MDNSLLDKMFVYDEGLNLSPYKCPAKKWTIGIGRNIDDNPIPGWTLEQLKEKGITREFAFELLRLDLKPRYTIANYYSWFKELNEARQAVILNILYIRPNALREWRKLRPDIIKAIEEKEYKKASQLMRTLKMALQLKNRFQRLTTQFESGIWHKEYKDFKI